MGKVSTISLVAVPFVALITSQSYIPFIDYAPCSH